MLEMLQHHWSMLETLQGRWSMGLVFVPPAVLIFFVFCFLLEQVRGLSKILRGNEVYKLYMEGKGEC